MRNINYINLTECKAIEDFMVLGELTNLEYLYIGGTNISESELQMLSGLTSIKQIMLNDNNIETLPDMTGWTNLEYIYLSGNKITEEEAMAKLPVHITLQEDWKEKTGLLNQRNNEDETADNMQEGNTGDNETTDNTQEDETAGNEDDTRIITSASDNSISAEGSFESDIYLEAKRIEDTSDYEDLIEQVQSRLTDIMETSIYDIWLYKKEVREGENIRIKVQPNGSVKVMIEIEEMEGVRYHVFRQEDDGTLTKLRCYIEGGTLIFYSEHFSIFSVVISRLLNDEDDEEYETEGNPHKSDNGNFIKVQQQGINLPLLNETYGNGEAIAKPTDKTKNEDNDSSADSNGNDSQDESSSTSRNDGVETGNKADDDINNNKLNNEEYANNSKKEITIESIAGIVTVVAVGAGLFGYDIMKRKRGDYMRNFQVKASDTDSVLDKNP